MNYHRFSAELFLQVLLVLSGIDDAPNVRVNVDAYICAVPIAVIF